MAGVEDNAAGTSRGEDLNAPLLPDDVENPEQVTLLERPTKRSIFCGGKKKYIWPCMVGVLCLAPIVLAGCGYAGFLVFTKYDPVKHDLVYDPKLAAYAEPDRLTLKWERGMGQAKFNLHLVTDPGDGKDRPMITQELYSGAGVQFVHMGLEKEAQYTYVMDAGLVDGTVTAMSALVTFSTTGPIPPVSPSPPGLKPSGPGGDTISLAWPKPRERLSPVVGYQINAVPAKCELRYGYECDTTQVTAFARSKTLMEDVTPSIVIDCGKAAHLLSGCYARYCCNHISEEKGAAAGQVFTSQTESFDHITPSAPHDKKSTNAYWYRVLAMSDAGSSDYSDWELHLSSVYQPEVPSGLVAPTLEKHLSNPTTNVIVWSAPILNGGDEIHKYTLLWDAGDATLAQDKFVEVPPTDWSMNHQGDMFSYHRNRTMAVQAKTPYRYILAGANHKGATKTIGPVTISSKDVGPPDVVDTPWVADASSSYLTLQWIAPSDGGEPITGYQVNQTELTKGDGCGKQLKIEGDSALGTFDGLKANMACNYTIRAKNAKGWGAWSSNFTAQTFSEGRCTNSIDRGVVLNPAFQTGFHGVMTHCGAAHMGDAQESADCLRGAFPQMSADCSICFGNSAHCGFQNCKSVCWNSPNSDTCIACGTVHCQAAEVTCTGIPKESLPV